MMLLSSLAKDIMRIDGTILKKVFYLFGFGWLLRSDRAGLTGLFCGYMRALAAHVVTSVCIVGLLAAICRCAVGAFGAVAVGRVWLGDGF